MPGHRPVILSMCRHYSGEGCGEAAEVALDESSLHVSVVHLGHHPHQPSLRAKKSTVEADHEVGHRALGVAGASARVNAVRDRAVGKEDAKGLGEDEGDETGEGRDIDLEEEETAEPSLL